MCLNPVWLKEKQVFVPCGKCSECLKHAGNDFAVRVIRECQNCKGFHFVTLTYDDDHLPLMVTDVPVYDAGKAAWWFADKHINCTSTNKNKHTKQQRDEFFRDAKYDRVTTDSGKVVKKYKLKIDISDDCFRFIAPSVCNKDVQRVLNCFKRRIGYKDFSYAIVPEYGGTTWRPHYHCLFFGLTDEQIGLFASLWKNGSTDVRTVAGSMEDITKVAKYVGKYASKGEYDIEPVTKGFAAKPKKMMSQGFGIGNKEEFDRLCDYYLCKDKYGDYDPDDTEFLEKHKDTIVEDVLARREFIVNGYHYPVPKYIMRKIFFNYEKRRDYRTWKYVSVYKANALQTMVTAYLFEHIRRDSDEERARFQRILESHSEDVQSYFVADTNSRENEKRSIEQGFITNLMKNNKL